MRAERSLGMDISDARGASSSNSSVRCRYDVFLSFRGGDTRRGFTDHLYSAFVHAGFHTFRDDDEIARGENIESEIGNAIRESRISVVVFSGDYASSRWCLDELVQIMERRRNGQKPVIPVFYDVDPSLVRKQTGGYAEAFRRHEIRFKEDMDKVRNWRKALREVADLAGMVLGNRYESLFIQEIVGEVRKRLDKQMLYVTPCLVGRHELVNNINMWLQDEANDVGVAAIYGVGGVGKTTVAKVVFNSNSDKFEGSSFLANIKEASGAYNGLISLQKQLILDLLKLKDVRIRNIDDGIMKIKEAICCRRVLVVFDDLDDLDQFGDIVRMRNWFSPGSKIIITTRNNQPLRTVDITMKFIVRGLHSDESLELLSWHAFGQGHPIEGYEECSMSIVKHCDGLPLALKVLGSSLSGESVKSWESALKKLEVFPNKKIQSILRISYDSLQDDHDKGLFLDIACFFIGREKNYAAAILEGCGFYAEIGISNLISRSLLYMDGNNLSMHQLIRDMARAIVFQESPKDPGKRSRVWRDEDAIDVLKNRSGTETVEGLSLDLRRIEQARQGKAIKRKESTEGSDLDEFSCKSTALYDENFSKRQRLGFFSWRSICNAFTMNEDVLETNALGKMPKLKVLHLNSVELIGDYGEFPKCLAWLCWNGFPMESIPAKVCLERLVALEMYNSKLRYNWKRGKILGNLKSLDLSHSNGLVRPLDLTGLLSLERLILKYCLNLEEIDESIVCLQKLLVLDLEGCKSLQKLSKEIGALKCLKKIVLSGCSKLKELPQELSELDSLSSLYLDGTSIGLSDSAFRDAKQTGLLKQCSWKSILQPWLIPRSPKSRDLSMAFLPRTLGELSLARCNLSDDALSVDLSGLSCLRSLNLNFNPIHKLPESIYNLDKLKFLSLVNCIKLQTVEHLPKGLRSLNLLFCSSLESIQMVPEEGKRFHLNVGHCKKVVEIQGLLKLKPMASADRDVISKIGLFNLESVGSPEIEMVKFGLVKSKGPLQVLHETGISSIFVPGAGVPSWYAYRGTGSSISFDVVRCADGKICSLNVCIVLGIHPKKNQISSETYVKYPDLIITNETNGNFSWEYRPCLCGVPVAEQDMLWLSHWRFEDGLETGDHITVSLRFADDDPFNCLLVKEFGFDPVYIALGENESPPNQDISSWYQSVFVSCYQNNPAKLGVFQVLQYSAL